MTVTTVAAPVVAPTTAPATNPAPDQGVEFTAALDAAIAADDSAGEAATTPAAVDAPASALPGPEVAWPDVDGSAATATATSMLTIAVSQPAVAEGDDLTGTPTSAVRAVAAEPATPAPASRGDHGPAPTAGRDATSFVPAVPDLPATPRTHGDPEGSGTGPFGRPEPSSTHASELVEPGAAPSPVLGMPTGAPTAVAPATTAAISAGLPPEAVPAHVAEQLSTHLRGVRSTDGRHEATLVLDPEHLGPVRVRLTLDDGALHVQLSGLQASTGDALRDALPDLRRQLAEAGLTLGSADVTDHGAWDGRDGRRHDPSPRRSTHEPREHSATVAPVAAAPRSHRTGGVDLVV